MNTEEALANRHFLVVDDEKFIRTLVARFLKRSGAAIVVEAADGSQAAAAIASYEMTFDAVISDINMRPVNGIDLLRAIRTGAGGLKRNTPVLLLTVHGEAEFVAEAMALDADAFVLKPVERKSLIDRILRVLESAVPIATAAHYATVAGASRVHTAPAALTGQAPPTKSAAHFWKTRSPHRPPWAFGLHRLGKPTRPNSSRSRTGSPLEALNRIRSWRKTSASRTPRRCSWVLRRF